MPASIRKANLHCLHLLNISLFVYSTNINTNACSRYWGRLTVILTIWSWSIYIKSYHPTLCKQKEWLLCLPSGIWYFTFYFKCIFYLQLVSDEGGSIKWWSRFVLFFISILTIDSNLNLFLVFFFVIISSCFDVSIKFCMFSKYLHYLNIFLWLKILSVLKQTFLKQIPWRKRKKKKQLP